MKIILNESQIEMIVEETINLDNFTHQMIKKFFIDNIDGDYKEFAELLKTSIEKSGCQKIEFADFNNDNIIGLALHDRAVINNRLLGTRMSYLIYAIFHEIAHQYQYRKYGANEMYKLHKGELTDEDALKALKKYEYTADEYGIRKAREFAKKGFFKLDSIPKSVYRTFLDSDLMNIIKNVLSKDSDKLSELSDLEVSEFLYNSIIKHM